MIDESLQEQACLYAVGALPAAEAAEFERSLAGNTELREFTNGLREATTALALTGPALAPAPALKDRVMAALPGGVESRADKKVARPDFRRAESSAMNWFNWVPWALAACLVAAAVVLLRQNVALAQRLTALQSERGENLKTMASLRSDLQKLVQQDRISQVHIAMLSSLLENSPKAVAVSVWDAEHQDGVLVVQNLTPLPGDKDYQLWVIDTGRASPVDAGVFSVDEKGNVHLRFKPRAQITSADKFAVTVEKKGGVSAPQGQMVLAGGLL